MPRFCFHRVGAFFAGNSKNYVKFLAIINIVILETDYRMNVIQYIKRIIKIRI